MGGSLGQIGIYTCGFYGMTCAVVVTPTPLLFRSHPRLPYPPREAQLNSVSGVYKFWAWHINIPKVNVTVIIL